MTGIGPHPSRSWISSGLDPLDWSDVPETGYRSDFDLNPEMAPAQNQTVVSAAVLTGLIEREDGYHVLLTRRSDRLRKHGGQVAFPGGRSDPGETPWQTALREAQEEVGLDPAHVTLAGLSTSYRTGTGYLVTPVVAFISPDAVLEPNADEVADIFETPFAHLMDLSNYEQRSYALPDGGTRHYYAMTWGEQLIWGATAGMLRALHDRLLQPRKDLP
jgi:8-oxo-dGTP pyrophosphatase MutT (NUDIX family)